MRRRILFWIITAILFVAGVVYITFFSSKPLATMKGGTVTEAQFIKQMKQSQAGQQTFAQLVISKVLQEKYGNQVDANAVNDLMALQHAEYGNAFNDVLSASGQTESGLRDQLKSSLLTVAAVANTQKFSDQTLQDAFKDYTPSMDISIIATATSDDAKKAIDELNGGAKFADVAKKYSTDAASKNNGGKVPSFDSTTLGLSDSVKKAAIALEKGKYTADPVQVDTGAGYVVIMKNDQTDKGDDWTKFRTQLTFAAASNFANDTTNNSNMQKMIGQVLSDAHVTVSDKDLKSVIDGYILQATKSSSSSSSSTSSSSSSSSSSSN